MPRIRASRGLIRSNHIRPVQIDHTDRPVVAPRPTPLDLDFPLRRSRARADARAPCPHRPSPPFPAVPCPGLPTMSYRQPPPQQQQQHQQQQQYQPPHRQPSPNSQQMDVDQPQGGNGQGNGNGPDYVYFERHPEQFESARQKSTGVRMRLELWYKEGVEGAVERRERSVPTSEFHPLCDLRWTRKGCPRVVRGAKQVEGRGRMSKGLKRD